MTAGQSIRHARNQRRMTQSELAQAAGLSYGMVAHIEHDRSPIPRQAIFGLARALNLPADEIHRIARILPPDVEAWALEHIAYIRRRM